MVEFDESPWTPDEILMMRSGEAIKIPPAQAYQSLAMIYRKAAAFDRLAALGEFSASEVDGEIVIHFAPCNLFHAPTLLEAIEALPQTNGEPKQ